MTARYPTVYDFLYPGVLRSHWQMLPGEQIALTGLLARMRPQLSLEIGVYYGGSLSLTAQFVDRVIAIDIDPAVPERFARPANVDLRIGDSTVLISQVLTEIAERKEPLGFILIDADHSTAGVRRDIDLVLAYKPIQPMVILVHDSGNPECREGILTANWAANPHVHFVEVDFVAGQLIETTVREDFGEVWGGFALAYLSPELRDGPPIVNQGARTSIETLHARTRGLQAAS